MLYKKSKIRIRAFSLLALVVLIMAGCQEDDMPDGTKSGTKKLTDTYISIKLSGETKPQLRSNPTGGEDGDGSENGLDIENEIKDITVVFYKGNDISSAANTIVSAVLHVGGNNILPGNITTIQKVQLEKDIYRVIVVTNVGNISGVLEGKTVKQVADYLQKTPWTVTNGNVYSAFVMSSAEEVAINLTESTSELNPAQLTVKVERLAARVDVIPNQGDNNTNVYSVIRNSETVAHVTITKVKLVNRLIAGTFLLKRVAGTIGGTPLYLGDETLNGGVQDNYVIDPWSSLKTMDNVTGNHFNITGGGSGTSPASALYEDYFDNNFSFGDEDNIKSSGSGTDYYVLRYTQENTMDKDHQLNGYTTGVIFETVYVPSTVINYNASTITNEVISNSSAINFFMIGNGNTIYNSLEAIGFISIIGTQPDDLFSKVFTTSNTWQDVKDYSDRLNNDILGFKAYLSNLLLGKTLSDNLTEPISWALYVRNAYGYSNSGGTVSLNLDGKDTGSLLIQRGVKAYENGLTYYPYWIRHSNNNLIESGIMEFAITRNNVYKLRVVSFSGIGKRRPFIPGIDGPDRPDENSNLNLFITVKPWRLILHPEIIL